MVVHEEASRFQSSPVCTVPQKLSFSLLWLLLLLITSLTLSSALAPVHGQLRAELSARNPPELAPCWVRQVPALGRDLHAQPEVGSSCTQPCVSALDLVL